MKKPVKRVAVSGAGGQIGYSILFRIAAGEMLGSDQPVALHLLELPASAEAVKGVVMELEDCAFPLLKEVRVETTAEKAFEGIHYALLIGARPRGPGMERKDLLGENGKIFTEQGQALNRAADKGVLVLVVGNPANTNCLIAMHHAPKIPRHQFLAMTRLDQNRAMSLLAQKAQVGVEEVRRMTIWGNHSSTQVPDFINAQIAGRPALERIKDRSWCEGVFIEQVQKRGAAVIAARGKSSAASAANAAIDAIRSAIFPTENGDWFSSGVCSDGNTYGIQEGLIFSFPCCSTDRGEVQIKGGVPWDSFLEKKIRETERELLEERDCVRHLLG